MAKIPLYGANQDIPGQISSVDTSILNRGTDMEALSRLGDAGINIGTALMEKRKKAETNDYIHSGLTDASVSISDWSAQDKMANPSGVGHRERLQDYLKTYRDEYSKLSPNEDASIGFNQGLDKMGATSVIDAEEWSRKTQAENWVNNVSRDTTRLANKHLLHPDIKSIEQDLNIGDARWADASKLNIDAKVAEKGRIAAKEQIAESFFDGMINNKLYAGATKMLKDPTSAVANSLTPDKRASLIAKLQNKVEGENVIKVADVHDKVNNYVNEAINNGNNDPNVYNSILKDIQNTKMSDYQRNSIKEKMGIAITVGSEKKNFDTMTNQQLQSYVAPTLTGSLATSLVRTQSQSILQNKAEAALKARAEDINGYINKLNDPEINNLKDRSNGLTSMEPVDGYASKKTVTEAYLDLRAAKATALGAMPRPLDKIEASQIRSTIVNAINSSDAAKSVEVYQNSMGRHLPGALAQAFKNEAESGYALMAYMPDKESMAKVYDAVKNAPATAKNLSSQDLAAIKVTTQAKLLPEIHALYGSGEQNAGVASALQQVVSLNARKYIANGESVSSSVDKSYKELIADNFVYAEGGQDSAGKARGVLVPRKVGNVENTQEHISSFLNTYSSPEGLNSLDISVDPKYKNPAMAEEQNKKAYLSAIAAHGKWILSPNQLGMTLVMDGANGLDVVKDSQGFLVQKSFAEMSSMPLGKVNRKR